MIVVLSLLISIFSAEPSIDIASSWSRSIPICSLNTLPPVSLARSSNCSDRDVPNPGAFTAATLIDPRTRFITKVDNASPSRSSATISNDLPCWTTGSNIGNKSFIDDIFLSTNKIRASSISVIIFSVFVTK